MGKGKHGSNIDRQGGKPKKSRRGGGRNGLLVQQNAGQAGSAFNADRKAQTFVGKPFPAVADEFPAVSLKIAESNDEIAELISSVLAQDSQKKADRESNPAEPEKVVVRHSLQPVAVMATESGAEDEELDVQTLTTLCSGVFQIGVATNSIKDLENQPEAEITEASHTMYDEMVTTENAVLEPKGENGQGFFDLGSLVEGFEDVPNGLIEAHPDDIHNDADDIDWQAALESGPAAFRSAKNPEYSDADLDKIGEILGGIDEEGWEEDPYATNFVVVPKQDHIAMSGAGAFRSAETYQYSDEELDRFGAQYDLLESEEAEAGLTRSVADVKGVQTGETEQPLSPIIKDPNKIDSSLWSTEASDQPLPQAPRKAADTQNSGLLTLIGTLSDLYDDPSISERIIKGQPNQEPAPLQEMITPSGAADFIAKNRKPAAPNCVDFSKTVAPQKKSWWGGFRSGLKSFGARMKGKIVKAVGVVSLLAAAVGIGNFALENNRAGKDQDGAISATDNSVEGSKIFSQESKTNSEVTNLNGFAEADVSAVANADMGETLTDNIAVGEPTEASSTADGNADNAEGADQKDAENLVQATGGTSIFQNLMEVKNKIAKSVSGGFEKLGATIADFNNNLKKSGADAGAQAGKAITFAQKAASLWAGAKSFVKSKIEEGKTVAAGGAEGASTSASAPLARETFEVKSGDSYLKIAAKNLGWNSDSKARHRYAYAVMELNGGRPDKAIRDGAKLRLPVDEGEVSVIVDSDLEKYHSTWKNYYDAPGGESKIAGL